MLELLESLEDKYKYKFLIKIFLVLILKVYLSQTFLKYLKLVYKISIFEIIFMCYKYNDENTDFILINF